MLAAVGLGALKAPGAADEGFSMPGIESQKAFDLMEQRFPGATADGATARVVFIAPGGERVTAADNKQAIEKAVIDLGDGTQVASAVDPFQGKTISRDGSTAFATVTYKVGAEELSDASRTHLERALVEAGGTALEDNTGPGGSAEVIGVTIAVLVLLVTFGSLAAAGLPLLTALIGVGVSMATILTLSQALGLSTTTGTLAKVPGCGWVRFRLSRKGKGACLPAAKTFRVTFRNGQWHIAFAVLPEPLDVPGAGEVIGIDRGVKITAALSDGRKLNGPQLTVRERARIRKHQRRAARAPKGARLKAREADRRKDWCEKTSTMLARAYGLVRFEKLNIKNMTRSVKGTVEQPGKRVRQKAGLNRVILAQGWGLLRQRTQDKAPGRVEDVPAPFTSLRCSACGWIEKKSRKSQADFV